MPADRSRAPDRTRFGYTGVVAQQGRVILDRDFNAQQSLSEDRINADALDFVGPCGTPDDGFRISLPTRSLRRPVFWQPPVHVTSSPPETPGEPGDFLIAPGTMYLGGQRVYWPAKQSGKTITYSYFDQRDWPLPTPPSSPPASNELVYLLVTEQEVSAVEDPDLLEVALGGPDTTQRRKLLARVERRAVPDGDCDAAWKDATEAWATRGWLFNSATMQLVPTARLTVGFSEPTGQSDPCDPVATGGYLGSENQLIRVRIDARGTEHRLLWSYDDASFIYRVSVGPDLTTLTFAADPPDAFHFPQTNQVVEILTTASVLAEEPDESDTTGHTQILRVVAEANGRLRQMAQPYGPLPGGTQNVCVLNDPLPGEFADPTLPVFLRVWQAAQTVPANGTVTLESTATDLTTGATGTQSTGVTATLSGTPLTDGAFWMIAVRPATPQGVYPEDLLQSPQPPDGPRAWACPLAVIDWSTGKVTDCRSRFENLVELTRRRPGCCTVSIAPRDITAAHSLQDLIDHAVSLADCVTVCLQPGSYMLPGTLYLDRRHACLTLEACGRVELTWQKLDDLTPFADGLIVVDGATDVTLRGLLIHPPLVQSSADMYQALLERLKKDGFAEAAGVLRRVYTSFGVQAFNALRLTLESCNVSIKPNDDTLTRDRLIELADAFAAAYFIRGDCRDLKIKDCTAESKIAPTYTRLAVDTTKAPPANLSVFNDLILKQLPLLDFSIAALPASPPVAPPASPPATVVVSGSPSVPAAARTDLAPARAESAPVVAVHGTLPSSPPPTSPPPSSPPALSAVHTSPPPTSPPQTSPPSAMLLLDRRVSDAIDLVAAKRLASDTLAIRFVVITVGLLCPATIDGTTELGEASVCRSEFKGFTFATWSSATMSSLRLENNTVRAGVAGLWLEAPGGAARVPNPAAGTGGYYQTMLLFEEYQLMVGLAATFPNPSPPRVLIPLIEEIATPGELVRRPPYALLCVGNQVDVRAADLGCSAAMMLALYDESEVQPLTSIIVASNQLHGGMSGITLDINATSTAAVPAAVMTLTNGTPCAITGNVIINPGTTGLEFGREINPSLWLTVSESTDNVLQLAVTGNTLQGLSDLAQIRRRGRGSNTWSLFNADPG